MNKRVETPPKKIIIFPTLSNKGIRLFLCLGSTVLLEYQLINNIKILINVDPHIITMNVFNAPDITNSTKLGRPIETVEREKPIKRIVK